VLLPLFQLYTTHNQQDTTLDEVTCFWRTWIIS